MLSLLNPSTILATLLIAIACVGGGYISGRDHATDACNAAAARASFEAAARFREELEAREESAKKEARREALASVRSQNAKSKGVADAYLNRNPTCNLNASTYGLLNSAISAANAEPSDSDKLSDVVRRTPPSDIK
jgi:hypothetical protein